MQYILITGSINVFCAIKLYRNVYNSLNIIYNLTWQHTPACSRFDGNEKNVSKIEVFFTRNST